MSEPSETRRQYLFIEAIDPVSGKLILVQISHDRLMMASDRKKVNLLEAAFLVPHVLKRPTAIFEGLRQEEDEDRRGVGWRCYCGIPRCSYRPDGTEAPPYRGKVFLVFVNLDGIAYSWRWDKMDRDDSCLPIDHEHRFKKRLL